MAVRRYTATEWRRINAYALQTEQWKLVVGEQLQRIRTTECTSHPIFSSLVYLCRWRKSDQLQTKESYYRRRQSMLFGKPAIKYARSIQSEGIFINTVQPK